MCYINLHFINLLTYLLLRESVIPGGAKKRPEICVTITARILYKDKFPFVHL